MPEHAPEIWTLPSPLPLPLRRVRGGGLWGVRWARGKNHTASEPRAHKKVFVTYDQGTQEGVNRVSVAPSSSV